VARHPLDPLTADEIRAAAGVLRRERGIDERWRFGAIDLREPSKAQLAGWERGEPVAREAELTVWSLEDGIVREALVDVGAQRLLSWHERPGVQAALSHDEWHECDRALRANGDVIAALARRGIEDLDLVLIDVWPFGRHLVPERLQGRRLGWCDVWVRRAPDSNPYARYVGGLHPIVDLNTMELVELEESYVAGLPDVMGEYAPKHVPGIAVRDDVRALEIVQPDGPSFTLDGHELRWQRWRMRVGFTFREGLVLHAVGYEDGGRVRPIAHRMSFAEMVIPYRDPSPDHVRRTAFDIGEIGLGASTVSLELGCDCLGEIRYLDAVVNDTRGEPQTIKNAVCIHEEDNAVLWKHVDPVAGAEVRRMRRLVVSFHATVANYEYLVYWRFYQDGNIECEVRATGIMVTSPELGDGSPNGTVVDAGVYAPFHQHIIVARLDMDVDGERNTVCETHTEAPPTGPENPHGLALVQVSTPLRSELEGRQDYDWASQRAWKVVNPSSLNAHGAPVAYKLVPGACFPPLLDPRSPVALRAQAVQHQLWVTPLAADERWPCGRYPMQGVDDGLAAWTSADRPIEDTDVVLWYVFGIHHITRVEDWPIMPADTVSFWLKPFGFFDRSPAIDVPPRDHCHPAG